MLNKVALLDLEHYMPSAAMFRELLEHHAMLYVFHCQAPSHKQFQYPLTDLTEFAAWISCGQVVVLETPPAAIKAFEYAMLVGQLLALVEVGTEIEIISAMPSSVLLLKLMQEAELDCHLRQVEPHGESVAQLEMAEQSSLSDRGIHALHAGLTLMRQQATVQALYAQVPRLIQALDQQPIKPLQPLTAWLARRLHLNLAQVTVQGPTLNVNVASQTDEMPQLDKNTASERRDRVGTQFGLYDNFAKVDRVQFEVLRRLNQLQADKPKDIYELRDLLSEMFPESDVGMLLKELLEKGYIYWNGQDVIYSHEMVLN
ncbi:hypothetical protein EC844_103184 [Acinetobacter calcoaceticus]|uniref:Uncharacterized protein n=1 Tax=Acinetobacter calcoaceticus TaxID=471 RepID=A0A4R1XX56_ACICA|nr:hypothetical protein EC844_103184 [Acinetobacter calcoaceticus]